MNMYIHTCRQPLRTIAWLGCAVSPSYGLETCQYSNQKAHTRLCSLFKFVQIRFETDRAALVEEVELRCRLSSSKLLSLKKDYTRISLTSSQSSTVLFELEGLWRVKDFMPYIPLAWQSLYMTLARQSLAQRPA